MNTLRIYFSALWRDSSTPCPWALCDGTGAVLQQGLSPLSEMPVTRNCIGILAADRVSTFTTTQPPGAARRWQAALPFIAEEHSLTDPDDIHAVPAPASRAGAISVSVMNKSWLKQIVAATTAAGLPLRRLIAESLMPALQADSWTLVWDGRSGFLRTSATTGLALDNGSRETPPLAMVLSLNAVAAGAPQCVELRMAGSASEAALPSWDLPVPLVPGEPWDWRRAPVADGIPNLLWGSFAPPLRLFDGLSRLRPALLILLAAFAIEVAGTHIEWAMLTHEKNTLTQQMERIFRGAFGDDSTLVNAPLQMRRNLASLRHAAGVTDDTDFLALLDQATQALGVLNDRSVRGLSYEDGKLELDVKLVNAAEFRSIEQRHDGLLIRISAMQDMGDGTQAKLTISREGLR